MSLLGTGSILTAFFAGMVALFVPCCIVFRAPSYLAAAARNRHWRLLPLTFVFAAGLALIMVPITLGMSLVAGTMLPIVMNTPAQIRADMAANGVRTPFLIDTNGTVSAAYGTLGKGMHAGLPGHSFVLIDTTGTQRWYGDYPSMYLPAPQLLSQVRSHLG